jgi:hypothetical protein
MLGDGGVFAEVEVVADLLGRVGVVIEEGDEGGDGALEVVVVLPQGVVGVEEQGLAGEAGGSDWGERVGLGHRAIIELDRRLERQVRGWVGAGLTLVSWDASRRLDCKGTAV